MGRLGASSTPPPGLVRFLTSPSWEPDVAQALEAMIHLGSHAERPIAALDFDRTLMDGDVSEHLLAWLDARDGTAQVAAYEEACRSDLRAAYIALVSTLVAGRTEPEVRAMTLASLAEGERKGVLAVREPMRELVWALHRHGWEPWVVTASPEPVIQPVAERFGIPPTRVIGMRSNLGPDGRYLAEVRAPATYREGKLEALRAATGRDPLFAAGDSRSDVPMLEAAPHALLLDHGDAELARHAVGRGWWIQPGGRIR